jgi:hypothetical protein
VSIRLAPLPEIAEPARAALVAALHDVITSCRFSSLEEVSTALPEVPPRRRLSELVRGTGRFPEAHEVTAVVRACAASRGDELLRLLYVAEAERSVGAAAAPRLEDVALVGTMPGFRDWDALGVHRPITQLSSGKDLAERVTTGELPAYVLRETDLDGNPATGLRAGLRAAAAGLEPVVRWIVITGESSAGKSRAGVEAMRAELVGWRLLIPYSADSLCALLDQHPRLAHTVVWLDEIDTMLAEPAGVAGLRRLLAVTEGPMVVLSTLRTDRETALGRPGWDLLDRRAHRITLHRRPPRAELDRELARARKLDDPWIVDALTHLDDRYGIAEWLAAGPQLLRHLDRARTRDNDPVARTGAALVDAAIDCYRAGYTSPIPEPLLAELYPLYLHTVDPGPGSRLDPTVFPAAVMWARQPVAGATGLLVHHHSRGDFAFDYLLSYASRPEAPPIAGELWAILSRHLTPGTLATVGIAANRNGRSGLARKLADRLSDVDLYAELGYRASLERLAKDGEYRAAERLAQLLAEGGERAELERRIEFDDEHDVYSQALNVLLANQGEEAELERRANADMHAAWELASLLFGRGDEAGLERFADAGDREATDLAEFAAELLAELLAERGDETGLARRAEVGDRFANSQLATLRDTRGDQAGVDTGDMEPASCCTEQSDPAVLQHSADAGDRDAAKQLARLLATRGDEISLERRADTGDEYAAKQLAELALRLAERGDEVELERRADTGDRYAAEHLANLLTKRGDEVGLERRADKGDQDAALRLAKLLFERGDEVGLERRAAAGDQDAARRLSVLLFERGDEVGLERRAAAGDQDAARRLSVLLHERSDHAGLKYRADCGDRAAALRLAKLLFEEGNLTELERRADSGDQSSVGWLNALLFQRGDRAGLEHRADSGDRAAAWRLAKLLFERGDLTELERRADSGDQAAAQRLAHLLFDRRDEAGLDRHAEGGNQNAARRLAVLLFERGDLAELERRAAAGDQVAAELARSRGNEGRPPG